MEWNPTTKDLKMTIASRDLTNPNGVTKNSDSSVIYVVDSAVYQIAVFNRDKKTNVLTLDTMIKTPHTNDNVKFDKETKTIRTGSNVYKWGTLTAVMKAPKRSESGVGGLTEYGYDSSTKEWWTIDHVVSAKLNGISNSVRVGDTLIAGSFWDEGLLVCKMGTNTPPKKILK